MGNDSLESGASLEIISLSFGILMQTVIREPIVGNVVHILLPSTGRACSRSVGDPGIHTAQTERALKDSNGTPDAAIVM